MTVATDFAIILADLGVTVVRTPVTTTTNFSGQKTYTDGSTNNVTAVFVNPTQNFALDKPGLTEISDAKLYVVATETINKRDKMTYQSKVYRVDKISKRIFMGTVGFKVILLFLI